MSLLAPITSDPSFQWNEKTARHLLNRAGFGAPVTAIKKLAALPPGTAVASFVDFDNLPDAGPPPPALPEKIPGEKVREIRDGLSEEDRREYDRRRRRDKQNGLVDMQTWWITRMVRSQRPLQEKVALMWHGHFATSAQKVDEPLDNLELNQIFRTQGTGNFRELVRAVGKSPCMLRYLDQQQSRKEKPNENWARELMELFTLGIGNYTERDIKEAARAFTGWTIRQGEFFNNGRRHDDSLKVIFNTRQAYDGDGVLDLIVSQPACAEFICKKIWTYFAYDDPEPEVISGLADTFRRFDTNLKPVLRQMFLSRAFYQEKAYFSQVKSPAQLVVGLMSQLDTRDPEVAQMGAFAMRAMGQNLFYPPNVKGWDGGQAWINTNTLLVRYNFSSFLVSGVIPEIQGSGAARRDFLKAMSGRDRDDNAGSGSMMQSDSGGDSMMMMGTSPDDDDSTAPVGQDAMPRDIASQTFYRKLRERRAERRETRNMTPEERRRHREESRLLSQAPFEAREFFSKFGGRTPEGVIEALEGYFLGFALDNRQRMRLKEVLAQGVPDGKIVPVDRMAEEDLRATVQLLLSTVEYQVC